MATITANRDRWPCTMMDEELHLQPVQTPDIFRSAIVITIATLALILAIVFSALALFGVGGYAGRELAEERPADGSALAPPRSCHSSDPFALPLLGLLSAVGTSGLMSVDDMGPEPREVPWMQMPEQTPVMEVGGGQLLWIDGVLPLPVGARIELGEPRVDGVVERVRLAAARAGLVPTLVLDVRLEDAGGAG
jgi:hypothetical protein